MPSRTWNDKYSRPRLFADIDDKTITVSANTLHLQQTGYALLTHSLYERNIWDYVKKHISDTKLIEGGQKQHSIVT